MNPQHIGSLKGRSYLMFCPHTEEESQRLYTAVDIPKYEKAAKEDEAFRLLEKGQDRGIQYCTARIYKAGKNAKTGDRIFVIIRVITDQDAWSTDWKVASCPTDEAMQELMRDVEADKSPNHEPFG